jgi:hypothetical protein
MKKYVKIFVTLLVLGATSIASPEIEVKATPKNYLINVITCMDGGRITGYGNSCVSGDSACIENGCPPCNNQ